MGFRKQMKDMKNVVKAAPDLMEQANQMGEQSQQMAAAQQQAGAVPGAPGELTEENLAPIEGISIEEYAKLSKQIGERGLDETGIANLMMSAGHTTEAWDTAYDGWNERFKGNTALAVHYGHLYASA